MIAQRLYEAGYITYMRTDSLNLSVQAIAAIASEITGKLGEKYLKTRKYHTHSKGAQEAHEAIRPTEISSRTIDGTAQEKKLYSLIWKRTIASQMADAEIEKTNVEITPSTRSEHFTATGEVVKFDGFLRVYIEGKDDETVEAESGNLPEIHKGDMLNLDDIIATQRFTQQPPRYTEASLVKKMEELGIGRPSTYAPTISTIQAREYVEKGENPGEERQYEVLTLHDGKIIMSQRTEMTGSEKGKLIPTDIGEVVNDFLTEYFPSILDYDFTAKMEEKFDDIAEGNLGWSKEIEQFYMMFHPDVDHALNMRLEHKVGERVLGTDSKGHTVSVKIGRFGPLVQIGDSDSEEKPKFASLLKGQSVATITLEEALKLFDFPRNLGTFEDEEVSVAVGKYGPYVKHNGKFVSIPDDMNAAEITLEEAVEMIKQKREGETKRLIKTFDEEPSLQILNGRYGPYIAFNKNNYKIPRTVVAPADLTLKECLEIIKEQDERPKKPVRRTATRKKS